MRVAASWWRRLFADVAVASPYVIRRPGGVGERGGAPPAAPFSPHGAPKRRALPAIGSPLLSPDRLACPPKLSQNCCVCFEARTFTFTLFLIEKKLSVSETTQSNTPNPPSCVDTALAACFSTSASGGKSWCGSR